MPFNNEVNQGSRFVDTQQTFYKIGPIVPNSTPKAVTGLLDCTQSLSYNLELTPTIPVQGGNPATLEFTILWFNVDQTTIIYQEIYEINATQDTGGDMVTTFIQGICRGAYAQIWLTGINLAPSMGTVTQLNGQWSTSSRPLVTNHIYQGTIVNPPVSQSLNLSQDGLLLAVGTTTLGAGASTGAFSAALTNKDLLISIGAASANWRLRGGFGAGALPGVGGYNATFTLITGNAAGANQNNFFFGPYKSITRPLYFIITNIATLSGQVNVQVWTQGAD